MREKMKEVIAPMSQPLSFAFPPEMIPPRKSAAKDKIIITHLNDDSCILVKVSKSETSKLVTIITTKMAIKPDKTPFPICLVSCISFVSPLQLTEACLLLKCIHLKGKIDMFLSIKTEASFST